MIWRVVSNEESFVFYFEEIVLKKVTKVRTKGIKNEKKMTKQEINKGRKWKAGKKLNAVTENDPNTQAYVLR
jgi:hypothetical protein